MKKNFFSFGAACLSGLLLSLLASCSPSNSSTQLDGYDISFDGDSSVVAKVENKENNTCKLVISGNGKIKDFANVSDAPYHNVAKKIDEVSIIGNITYVGRNAFRDLSITSIVLPKSVTSIGYTIVNDGVNICSLGSEEISVQGKQTVYYYSEKAPHKDFHFYVKGASNQDITSTINEDSTLYWHYVGEEVSIYQKKKVLFIGNSFTFRNGTSNDLTGGIPRIFSEIAYSLDAYVETFAITGSALTLAQHADKTSETGAQINKLLTSYSDFDHIILQEQSTKPLTSYSTFESGANDLATSIRATNPNAKIDLYETWGYGKALNETYKSIPAMERALFKAYNKCSLAISANAVRPVGRAFTYVHNDAEHDVNLYASDNMHQSYYGAYLSASVMASSILNLDVRNTTYVNDPTLDDSPDTNVLTYLKEVANSVVNDPTLDIDSDQNYESLPLNIAVWGRYISEENFLTLLTAYKDYAFEHEMGVNAITYKYYAASDDTSAYWYVADFSKAVTADATADVLFPVGNNINSSGNMDNSVLTNDRKSLIGNCFGQASRYVARLNDEVMSLSFFNWVLSDEAKVIMDPDYVPDVTPPVTQTHDLEVSVWGRYISEENFLTLWNTFKTTADYTSKDLHYTYYEGTSSGVGYYNVDSFVAGIKQNGGTDVVFPAGANIADAGKLEGAVENIAMGINVFGVANRYVAYYNTKDLTLAFKDFIISDLAKSMMDDTFVPEAPIEPETPDLKIAVWSRYISEENFVTLLDAFKTTSESEGKTIEFTIYAGQKDEPYYNVDPFVAKVKEDGADIIFPAGANIGTKWGETLSGYEAMATTVFGQTGRYVAWTNENELTIAFKNWINSDTALRLMNDEYEPPVDYSLHIAVWGRYISEENFITVLEAFKTHCQALETPLDTTQITYTYSTTNANADFVAEVEALETFADVIFPAGKATNGALTTTSIHNTALNGSVFGQSSRYVVTRSEKVLAEAFYNWITSAAGETVYTA